MRSTRKLATIAATSIAAAGLFAVPASAVDATQEVTFQVDGGLLTIVAPAAVTALNVAGGTLGTVTVEDLRVPASDWTVSVKVSDFTATVPTDATILASQAQMWIPGGTVVGVLTTASTTHNETNKLTLSSTTSQTLVTTTGSETGNSATFAPSMSVNTTGATAAIYTGTVTYTAA